MISAKFESKNNPTILYQVFDKAFIKKTRVIDDLLVTVKCLFLS